MAFHVINHTTGRFGRGLVSAGNHLIEARDQLDLDILRITEMTDAQFQSEYGFSTLTRTQALNTLSAAQAQLAHASITALCTQIG